MWSLNSPTGLSNTNDHSNETETQQHIYRLLPHAPHHHYQRDKHLCFSSRRPPNLGPPQPDPEAGSQASQETISETGSQISTEIASTIQHANDPNTQLAQWPEIFGGYT